MTKIIFMLAILTPIYSLAFLHKDEFKEYIDQMSNMCSEYYNFETNEVISNQKDQALSCLQKKSEELINFIPIVQFGSNRSIGFQTYKINLLSTQTQKALAKIRYQLQTEASSL